MKQNSNEPFIPSEPAFNDGHSSLSDFLWKEKKNKEATHASDANTARAGADSEKHNPAGNAIPTARLHAKAIEDGAVHGEEYYTEANTMLGQDELFQSDAAVESRQISKEEFPQG